MCPVKPFYDDLARLSGVRNIRNFLLVTFLDLELPKIGPNDRMTLYSQVR